MRGLAHRSHPIVVQFSRREVGTISSPPPLPLEVTGHNISRLSTCSSMPAARFGGPWRASGPCHAPPTFSSTSKNSFLPSSTHLVRIRFPPPNPTPTSSFCLDFGLIQSAGADDTVEPLRCLGKGAGTPLHVRRSIVTTTTNQVGIGDVILRPRSRLTDEIPCVAFLLYVRTAQYGTLLWHCTKCPRRQKPSLWKRMGVHFPDIWWHMYLVSCLHT
mmetsp:Transcript_121328/g.210896  ORF Transcript_121328/g.210896 Transcript_121328/m.210896 type:complete len:216 (+) Transcript_121328:427-1074(+)